MKPSDRLKEIEEHNQDCAHMEHSYESVKWLIARIHRLTEALEFYASPWGEHHESPIMAVNKFTQAAMNKTCEVARKALEEE